MEHDSTKDTVQIDCPHCGNFALTGSLETELPSLLKQQDAKPKLSHALRRSQESSTRPLFDTYAAEAALKQPLPRPREQADFLVRWLAENSPGPGEKVWVNYTDHGAIIGAKSKDGFELVIDHLFDSDFVTGQQSKTLGGGDKAYATLTFAGWEHYEDLLRSRQVYRKAFMAMQFDDPALESILENVLKPGAKRAGFDLYKLTDRPTAGLIDNRMRVEIQASDFVVADLSHDNPGAYWEAGYAEGLDKPVIYTCEKSKFEQAKTHFDTNHHLTILWNAEAPNLCSEEFTATIRATLPHIAKMDDGIE
ncbi:MAG: hypothetical protein HGB06_07120 [Chlorobaculum sp.]|jgi:nucleoside 2-deoxyribosyltransferase|nr:hypothetical protein [Chlorobaculum sp.]